MLSLSQSDAKRIDFSNLGPLALNSNNNKSFVSGPPIDPGVLLPTLEICFQGFLGKFSKIWDLGLFILSNLEAF